eukprot:scaffold10847_cov17-Tisochrysis_lutea.AAC.1
MQREAYIGCGALSGCCSAMSEQRIEKWKVWLQLPLYKRLLCNEERRFLPAPPILLLATARMLSRRWLDDEPARITGRMEIRPAAELGPIILCLDTSGSMKFRAQAQWRRWLGNFAVAFNLMVPCVCNFSAESLGVEGKRGRGRSACPRKNGTARGRSQEQG